MSRTLVEQGPSAKPNGLQSFVALDGNWFYYHINYESIWNPGDERAPEI
jgi:hypothetical protein